MPFEIVKENNKFRVKNMITGHYYSKQGLSLNDAKKQRSALIASEWNQPIRRFETGVLNKPTHLKIPHVPGKPKDFGDVILGILEPGERIISVENNQKIEKLIQQGKIPKLPGF